MEEILDFEAWRQMVVGPLSALGAAAADFLPNLVGAGVIFGVGWIAAKLVELVAGRLLHQFGLDGAADRLRVSDTLRRAGLTPRPSDLVARLLFWGVLLVFGLSAVETLGLAAVTGTVDRLAAFVPNLVAATLIFLLGLLLGRFARNLVSSGAAAAALSQAPRLGAASQGVVVTVVGLLALEQLGIATELLVTLLTTLLATAGLTMGVAFALGARNVIGHILAGHFLRQSLPRDVFVEVAGHRGVVQRVGATDTLLRNGDESWSIPNAQLIEHVVHR